MSRPEIRKFLAVIAYMILAHNQPAHVARLVRALEIPGRTKFYLHVDKRVEMQPFQDAVSDNAASVKFVTNRVRVFWRGYSMIEATLCLLKAALSDRENTRFCLLSGADFPVADNGLIENQFLGTRKEFISSSEVPLNPSHKFWSRYCQYHFYDNRFLNPRGEELSQVARKHISGYLNQFCASLPDKVPPFDLHVGYQWWSLTRACVQFMINYMSEHQEAENFFRYTNVPDEALFQSIVRMSPQADNIEVKPLHYVDWKQKGRIGELPKVLDETDYLSIRNSGRMLARKFDETVSAQIIEQLEQDRSLMNN